MIAFLPDCHELKSSCGRSVWSNLNCISASEQFKNNLSEWSPCFLREGTGNHGSVDATPVSCRYSRGLPSKSLQNFIAHIYRAVDPFYCPCPKTLESNATEFNHSSSRQTQFAVPSRILHPIHPRPFQPFGTRPRKDNRAGRREGSRKTATSTYSSTPE